MGCDVSIDSRVRESVRLHADLLKLGFEETELGMLYIKFCEMNRDHSGKATPFEFFMYHDLDRDSFTEMMFRLMDADGDGLASYREYVIFMWNACTLDGDALVLFTYGMYNGNSAGRLKLRDVEETLAEALGPSKQSAIDGIMRDLRHAAETAPTGAVSPGTITQEMFVQHARRNQTLLYPGFQLQTRLRKMGGGPKLWASIAKRREVLGLLHPDLWTPLIASVSRPSSAASGAPAGGRRDGRRKSSTKPTQVTPVESSPGGRRSSVQAPEGRRASDARRGSVSPAEPAGTKDRRRSLPPTLPSEGDGQPQAPATGKRRRSVDVRRHDADIDADAAATVTPVRKPAPVEPQGEAKGSRSGRRRSAAF